MTPDALPQVRQLLSHSIPDGAELASGNAAFEARIRGFPGILLVTNTASEILYTSAGAERILGLSTTDTLSAFSILSAPETPSEKYMEPKADPLWDFLTRLRRSQGAWHYIELRKRRTRFAGEKTLNMWGRADLSVSPTRIYLYLDDRSAESQMAELLIHAQKGEALGLLCASLAHDLNNVLTILTVQLEQMKERQDQEKPGPGVIDKMLAETEHSADLVQQILSFGKSRPRSHFQNTDLRIPLRRAAGMVGGMLPPDVAMILRLPEEELLASIDSTMIEQVVINLCLNARDALSDTGSISVKATALSASSPPPGNGQRAFVEIEVTDTGTGIAPEVLPHVFEPFFSTKKGKGTGLGLSSARWIAEYHGGSIAVESALGKGSTFRILLPAGERAPANVSA